MQSSQGVAERDGLISDLRRQMETQVGWATQSSQEVAKRDGLISDLQRQLEEQAGWAMQSSQEVENRDKVVLDLRQQLANEHQLIRELRAGYASSNILNQEFQNQVSVMKEELANVRRERYALEVENRVLAAELERIDRLEQRLGEVDQSRIWRTLVALSSPFSFLSGRSKR